MSVSVKAPSPKYLKLIKAFPLRPIRSDEELEAATRVVRALAVRSDLTEDERDYLEVLGDQIVAYETAHYPMPDVSGADMLRHLIDARGLSQAEVARATGIGSSTLSEILRGRRNLAGKHLRVLAKYLKVDPGVFAKERKSAASHERA